jgi:hypothetical protein
MKKVDEGIDLLATKSKRKARNGFEKGNKKVAAIT